MAKLTIATGVLAELRRSSRPLDDGELPRRLGVSPRQTINQACRRLERAGRLQRYLGSEGKIVNEAGRADPAAWVAAEGSVPDTPIQEVRVQTAAHAVGRRA